MKRFSSFAAAALLLLTTAALAPGQPAAEEASWEDPLYTIRVTAANERGSATVKVLKLEIDGEDARQFTEKTTPFEIDIGVEDFEAEFEAVPGERAKVELLGEESADGENITLKATGVGRIQLVHRQSPGGVIRVID